MGTLTQEQERSGRPGILYVVATPIGNRQDISGRALEILRSVDLILCEDTRHTRLLLSLYAISTHCLSLHEHNERSRISAVLERLQVGNNVALVSDAGTPVVSDPGQRLTAAVAEAGITLSPIPGPSAVAAILSVAGLPADQYVFEGFLPPKSGRRSRRLGELAVESRTLVLFESPHRIARTLAELLDSWGDRRVCLGRELTKKFEEVRHGRLTELIAWAEGRSIRGEIVLAVAGAGWGDATDR